ncbi:hypothetical protein [Bradyrhizobium guangzhouense]|uniref:Uncharacterized protein n=1 Tax=Bradyrhizobium guangzhouense TaxID=1325095 RepID=A0AAE5X282_9BRAD|nr:hypothetical protein [Bradyrhizobium guangzhouense]QAU47338.1 hypothetical protein XH91_19585 [Bradyrhizobium guangzhouense]RXH08203.1 hypothetical protein EAS56_29775 [Bradyrhizobium guangzhouense]
MSDTSGTREAPESTWLERLEASVISFSRIFAMLAWAIIAAPVWLTMIVVALLFLLLLTVVRALTAINFSIDRQLLRMVARSYPNGFRYLQVEFNKLKCEMDDDEGDVGSEWSYVFSTIHMVLLCVIAATLYCLYSGINVLSLPQYAYAGAIVLTLAAFALAWLADRRRGRISVRGAEAQQVAAISERVDPAG